MATAKTILRLVSYNLKIDKILVRLLSQECHIGYVVYIKKYRCIPSTNFAKNSIRIQIIDNE